MNQNSEHNLEEDSERNKRYESNEPKLKDGETFEEYVERIERDLPYGRGSDGLPHLFPIVFHSDIQPAWREEMGYRSDWTEIRRTGIGTKFSITLILVAILFFPTIIGIPLIYFFHYGSLNLFYDALVKYNVLYLPFIVIGLFLTKLIGYALPKIDEILKPYGKEHESVKLLFKDDLEYLKFSRGILSFNWLKWLKVGFLIFLVYMIIALIPIINEDLWSQGTLASLPSWTRFILIPATMGVGLVIFYSFFFLMAIIYGLFQIGDLGSDRSNLSITKFKEMINTINEMVAEAQLNKKRLSEFSREIDITGKTFYEFQRGNRKIGELFFDITSFLILFSILFAVGILFCGFFNIIPDNLISYANFWTIAMVFFVFLSFAIFIFPQWRIHKFLKDMKYSLIDSFTSLVSRLEYLYLEGMIHPDILKKVDHEWKSRRFLLEDIEVIKGIINKIESYGTWSYDFPEVMKIALVSLSTAIPVIVSITRLSFFNI